VKRYQVVWWGLSYWPWRFGRAGAGPYRDAMENAIYRWRFVLGPVEIRRWAALAGEEKKP
jgi:hypothetical protein